MKLPKFNLKLILPLFIALIFISSIFVVFSSGGIKMNKARLIVDFGQPGMLFDKEIALASNTTAVRLLSANAQRIELKDKQIYCIVDYCNTNVTKWYFYTVKDTGLGPQETYPGVPPDDYIVQNNDIILFRYQMAKNTTV